MQMSNARQVPRVPGLSRNKIEAAADQVVRHFHPELWSEPGPIPVRDFLEYSLRTLNIDYGVSDKLGLGVEGMTYPRGQNRDRPEIVLSADVMQDLYDDLPRARFTTAHEIAHGILHARHLKAALVEGRRLALFRRQELPRYEDPEWQGHVFAGAYLMPTRAVQAHVTRWGADPGTLAEAFNVSYSAAETRLYYLGR